MIEIAEKIADALDRLGYPGGNALFLEEAMKAAGLVEIQVGMGWSKPAAVGLMLKSVAESLAPAAYSMGYTLPPGYEFKPLEPAAVIEPAPAVSRSEEIYRSFAKAPETHTYQFDFKLLGSVTVTAADEATARDMAVDALTEAELSVCSGGNLPPTFTASLEGDLELMEVDGKDVS